MSRDRRLRRLAELLKTLEEEYCLNQRSFGNARSALRLYEQMKRSLAARALAQDDTLDLQSLLAFQPADV